MHSKYCKRQLERKGPQFSVGDTVRVDVKIREGERERIQSFEGTVIARKGGISETLLCAAFLTGSGLKGVPAHSPNVAMSGYPPRQVRRSKLYYLRERQANLHVLKSRLPATSLFVSLNYQK